MESVPRRNISAVASIFAFGLYIRTAVQKQSDNLCLPNDAAASTNARPLRFCELLYSVFVPVADDRCGE